MTYRDGQVPGSSARNDVRVLVKSTRGEIDFHPRSMPLRMVAEVLHPGAFHIFSSITRVVYIHTPYDILAIHIDLPLPDGMGTPMIVDGIVFVPVRYVADILGADVRWDASNRAVYIYRG